MSEKEEDSGAGCLFIIGVIAVSVAVGGLAGYLYGLLCLGLIFVVWAIMVVNGRVSL